MRNPLVYPAAGFDADDSGAFETGGRLFAARKEVVVSGSLYLPSRQSGMIGWGENFITVVKLHAEEWSVPQAEIAALEAAFAEFKTWFAKASGSERTDAIVQGKNDALRVFVRLVQDMVKYRLSNPAVVTDAARVEAGLNVLDRTRTTARAPQEEPSAEFEYAGPMTIAVHYRRSGAANRARPPKTRGAMVRYCVGDAPAQSLGELTHSAFSTRTPYRFPQFSLEERGKWLSVALCWQSTRGKDGPAGPMIATAIP